MWRHICLFKTGDHMGLDTSDLKALLDRAIVISKWDNHRKIIKARKLMSPALVLLDKLERWYNWNLCGQFRLIYRIRNNYWGAFWRFNYRQTFAYRKVAPHDFKSQ